MASFKANPNTCSKHFAIPADWCECQDTFECAFSVNGARADFESVTVNGFSADIAASATNEELEANIIAALVAVGMTDYNSSNVSYDGSVLTFNEKLLLEPTFTIAGEEVKVNPLCNEVEYCEYEYAGADSLTVQVDGVDSTDFVYEDGTYTVTAPKGSAVTVGGNIAEACLCGIVKYEA